MAILGPAGVTGGDGRAVLREVRGPRQVGTLALLVAHRGRAVRREAIEDELWRGERVSSAAVRVNVARLRRLFDEVARVDPIVASAAGYRLSTDLVSVDADRFLSLAADAAKAGHDGAGTVERWSREALGLWRGQAYEGAIDLPGVTADRVRLEEVRCATEELHAAALLVLGRPADAFDALVRLLDDDPFRERPWQLAMAALHTMGRSAEALRAHDRLARLLRTELGVAPGSEVEHLRAAIAARRGAEEVIALSGAPVAAGRAVTVVGAPSAAVPLVGRIAETTLLARLLDGTVPRIVVLESPAGLGKSRLAVEAGALARGRGLVTVTATCPRPDGTGPLVVRQLVGGLLAARQPTLEVDPSVEGLLDVAAPRPGVDAGAERLRVFAVMERLVAEAGDVLVAVDDVQWMDPAVAPLIAHLAAAAPGVRWLVLARTGDRTPSAVELLGDLTRLGAQWHQLAPLDLDDASALVRQLAPGLDDLAVDGVVARGAGSPLLLGELARHLARGGDPGAVPASIDAVVAAEVGRLGPEVAAVAAALAVAGDPHPLRVVTAAAGLHGAAATRSMTALVSASLAGTDVRRSVVWPSHDLVREALLAPLAHHEVQDLHRRLAQLLGDFPGSDPALVLRHLLADDEVDAGELERLAARALDDPRLYGAPHEVARLGGLLIERAGESGISAEAVATRLRIASARFGVGDASGGRRLVEAQNDAVAHLADPVLEARLIVAESSIGTFGNATAAALAAAEEVLGRVPADEAALRITLACWIGFAASTAQSAAHARRLADIADDIRASSPPSIAADPMVQAQVVTMRLAASMCHGSPQGETDQMVDELQRLAAVSQDPTTLIAGHLAQVERAMRSGTIIDVDRAVAAATELDTPVQRVETRWFVAACRAATELMRGDLAAAEAAYIAAMVTGAAHGVGPSLAAMLLHRFVVDWEMGRFGAFHPLLPPLTPDTSAPIALSHVFACVATGDDAGAADAADRTARPGLIAVSGPGQWGVVAAMAGHAAWAAGHAPLGREVADALAGMSDEGLCAVGLCYLGPISLARGLALLGAGELDAGLVDLETAIERERWVGAPITLARAATAAAAAKATRDRPGDRQEARRLSNLADEARATIVRAPGTT